MLIFGLAKFSHAQALTWLAEGELPFDQKQQAWQLAEPQFPEVFEYLRFRVAEITEPKIQMTLNYVLAICAKHGKLADANWVSYVHEVYRLGGRLPPVQGFRVYSPLSKADLVYSDLKAELQAFERAVPKGTRRVA